MGDSKRVGLTAQVRITMPAKIHKQNPKTIKMYKKKETLNKQNKNYVAGRKQ
jgi:hypothetical protein